MNYRMLWTALVWQCLGKELKMRLVYMEELVSNLFVPLPDATKRTFVKNAQSVLNYPTFVETGTFRGDMSLHASRLFSSVHTIELSEALADYASQRFAAMDNITLYRGDSGMILASVLKTIDTSCIFWLDAHYCGGITARAERDTPILAELEAIAQHHVRPHAVLIDDARVFGTDQAYPTLEAVIECLRRIDRNYHIGVGSDTIWASPVRLLNFQWRRAPSGLEVIPSTAAD